MVCVTQVFPIYSGTYIVFPVEYDDTVQESYKLEFDPQTNQFKRFTKLAQLPKKLEYPTSLIAKLPRNAGGNSIVFISQDGIDNFAYSIENNSYRKLAALTNGYVSNDNFGVNFKNKAIFTFFVDKKIVNLNEGTGIKLGVMDLISIDNDQEKEAKKQIECVSLMTETEHEYKFTFSGGVAMADDHIALIAQRYPISDPEEI